MQLRKHAYFAALSAPAYLAACAQLFCASPPAQVVAHRQVSMVSLRFTDANNAPSWLQCIPNSQTPLAIEWSSPSLSSLVSIPAPFEHVMGGQWLGGQKFLLFGVSNFPAATQSRLSCFDLVPQPPSIVESESLVVSGVDMRAACWNPALGLLLVAEGVSGTLVGAPWAPSLPIPDWSNFQPLFDSTDVPLLQSNATIAIQPTSMGLIVLDSDLGIGRQATLLGTTWAFADWQRRGASGPRWAADNHQEAPTESNLQIRLEGSGGSGAEPFQIAAVDDGMIVAQGTHPGAGTHLHPAPPVFHALPGRTFVLSGGSRRAEHLTPILRYGSSQSTPVVAITGDLGFRPELCAVGTEKNFGLTAQFKRGSTTTAQSYSGYVLIGIRNGNSDPVTQAGIYTVINGLVLQSFSLNFPAGERELHVRRAIAIPNDDGFANLVVLFQIVIDDGAGGWITSTIKGTAIRPRAAATASLSSQEISSMSQTEYLHHCRQLVNAADRPKARAWVLTCNPQAVQQMTQLKQNMSNQ